MSGLICNYLAGRFTPPPLAQFQFSLALAGSTRVFVSARGRNKTGARQGPSDGLNKHKEQTWEGDEKRAGAMGERKLEMAEARGGPAPCAGVSREDVRSPPSLTVRSIRSRRGARVTQFVCVCVVNLNSRGHSIESVGLLWNGERAGSHSNHFVPWKWSATTHK